MNWIKAENVKLQGHYWRRASQGNTEPDVVYFEPDDITANMEVFFLGSECSLLAHEIEMLETYEFCGPIEPPCEAASGRFDRFVKALEALCVEHGVRLSTSVCGKIQVFPLENAEEPIYRDIENELN